MNVALAASSRLIRRVSCVDGKVGRGHARALIEGDDDGHPVPRDSGHAADRLRPCQGHGQGPDRQPAEQSGQETEQQPHTCAAALTGGSSAKLGQRIRGRARSSIKGTGTRTSRKSQPG